MVRRRSTAPPSVDRTMTSSAPFEPRVVEGKLLYLRRRQVGKIKSQKRERTEP